MGHEQDDTTGPGRDWEGVLLSLSQELTRLGIRSEGNVFDLTPLPNAVVLDLLKFLSGSHLFVLHGSNSARPYSKLVARQANDASKESGNKRAVYATSDARIALTRALINHGYLSHALTSYTQGYEADGDRFIIKATPDLYRLFLGGDQRLFADGYVYVLRRSEFTLADGTNNEFQTEQDQPVSLALKVSRRLKETLFVLGQGDADTVLPYSEGELQKIGDARTRHKL